MEVERPPGSGEAALTGPSVRWHPAFLQPDEQSNLHSHARPGAAAWPGRIVGVHRTHPPATTGPFADARRAPPDSMKSESTWRTAASTSDRMHAGAEPQRCYSAPLECAEDLTRPRAHYSSSCSRGGERLIWSLLGCNNNFMHLLVARRKVCPVLSAFPDEAM